MKRPTMLYQAMLEQVSIDLKVSTERDFEVIRSRLQHEGLSFLTLALPTLSDSLESGIESGRFTLPAGFKPAKRGGTLPALLQGLFKRVFSSDGVLLQDPCAESIYWIRQVSRFFKKPKIPCTAQREAAAIRKFLAVEEDLRNHAQAINRLDASLDVVSRILWSSVFPTVDTDAIVCGHGPGVTADRLLHNKRRRIRMWYQRFEDSFPVADHAFHNYGEAWSGGSSDGVSGIEFVDVKDEPPVRVVFVPKTLSAPRVIAIEPSCMQFVQQGLSRWMTSVIEGHRLTRNSVRFSDQTRNQQLAYSASIDRRLATIDLSDASDRVHSELVNRIFKSTPLLLFLQDARSLHADLPNGQNIVLRKYASMGSALCFPVEACVFYTLILAALHNHEGVRPTYASILKYSKDISVFGDDLIIKTEYVDVVTAYLESYALRVNSRKSFSASKFRESCGSDYFNGVSVLPIYARQVPPERIGDWTPAHVSAWVSTANQFYMAGKWHLCQAVRGMLECVLNTKIPRSRVEKPGVGFSSLLFDTHLRYNSRLCGWEQKRLQYIPLKKKDNIDGDSAACFNKSFERVSRASKPLGSADGPVDRRHHTPVGGWKLQYSLHGECSLNRVCETANLIQGMRRILPVSVESGLVSGRGKDGSGVHFLSRGLLELGLAGESSQTDFSSTTKRGAFALKRRWIMIFS